MTAFAFTYDVSAPRVVFGAGAVLRLREEVDRFGASRVLVLGTPGRSETIQQVADQLGGRSAGAFLGARMHVPAEVVEQALMEAARVQADLCVSVGGGSAIGLGKALALREGPPFIAVPTTYAGSEMTPIWGISDAGRKTTGRDGRVLARTVVYDPLLTLSLPASVTGPSGINALAHCVEALYAPDRNPITGLIAEQGIRALAESLPVVVRQPGNLDARTASLFGACLAGSALGAVTMGLHHRICHALGGGFDLPHAETHAVTLPYVVAFNAAAAPDALERVHVALGRQDAAEGLRELAAGLGCPTSLHALGLREGDLDAAAEQVAAKPYPNPRPFTRQDIRSLLDDAYHGRWPPEPF